jgi:hypothetical protein
MMQARDYVGAAQDAAREAKGMSEAARMASLSAGQAAAVAHVSAHELGAAAYAIRVVMQAAPKGEKAARIAVRDWPRGRLPEQIRELVLDDQRLRNELCWFVFGDAVSE